MTYRLKHKLGWSALVIALSLIAACTPVQRQLAKDGGPRQHAIDMIVIHAVSGPKCDPDGQVRYTMAPPVAGNDADYYAAKIKRDRRQVSIHYVIGRAGNIAQGVGENVIAYHAGNPDVNGRSIGIELVNNGDGKDPFPPAQIDALIKLIKTLRARYAVPLAGIVRHADVDQRLCTCPWTEEDRLAGEGEGVITYPRRPDPGAAFPFEAVRAGVARPGEAPGHLDFTQLKGLGSKDACS